MQHHTSRFRFGEGPCALFRTPAISVAWSGHHCNSLKNASTAQRKIFLLCKDSVTEKSDQNIECGKSNFLLF